MSKTIKKVASIAAPVVGNYFAPGIGGVIGGAVGGGLSGGGLKGIAGGALGGAALGYGGALGGALSDAGGLGLGAAGANALGSGVLGTASGGLLGGGKGALIGGALGGLGGYYKGGGFDGVLGGDSGVSPDLANGDVPLTAASGVPASSVGSSPSLFGNLLGSGTGGASSSYGPLTSVASGLIGSNTNDETQKALLAQQKNALNAVSPYLNESFTPGDLTQDPGYQFDLSEGTKALDRTAASRGNYYSGQALTDAATFGQGLADKTYNDAYQRWLNTQGQKLGAVNSALNIYDNTGNINANAATNQGNLLTSSLAGVLGGQGLSNTGSALGSGALGSVGGDLVSIAGKQYYKTNSGQLIPIG